MKIKTNLVGHQLKEHKSVILKSKHRIRLNLTFYNYFIMCYNLCFIFHLDDRKLCLRGQFSSDTAAV
jgi:hypothetical protein